tara:strand:+ start:9794 stop:10942 length:1149 start_codon:yes stop_codon:yes gene_type:complete
MIAFFTYDLLPGRERLMPWRTIIEVCKVFRKVYNRDVTIYSLDSGSKTSIRTFQTINIQSVDRAYYMSNDFFTTEKITTIFFPVVWRSTAKSINPLALFKGNKIAYFPGGVYAKSQTLRALRYISLAIAKPYLAEAFIPKSKAVSLIKKTGFDTVIALSDLTRDYIIKGGFPEKNVVFIPPGKDLLPEVKSNISLSINSKTFYKDGYFFFMGAPAKIRGLELLLKAFDKACQKNKNLKLLCFLRTDPGSDNSYINKIVEKLAHKLNIEILWEEVSRETLFNFVANARAVILPFVLIPSEIPLTYFEVLSLGTTIISTSNGGTTEYLNDAIFVSERNEESLSQMILKVSKEDALVNTKRINAKLKMQNHLSWHKVGEKWYNLI